MARSIAIAALFFCALSAYGRGWTSWDYTNGEPGLVQYQQLMSCAVERCSAVGVTFEYVTSNRVSSGYTVSGYGYSTSVVAGVTNVVRWTNYVESATWVFTTNRLHDAPSIDFILYLDQKYREVLAGNWYADSSQAGEDGTYDSYYAWRTNTTAGISFGVLWGTGVLFSATSATIPPLGASNVLAYLTNYHADVVSGTNLYVLQPVYEGQDKVLAATMMARRQVTNVVVSGGATTISYRVGFSGIAGPWCDWWSSAKQIYVPQSTENAPVGGVLRLSLPCDECAVTDDVPVTIWGLTTAGVYATNSFTLSSGSPEVYHFPPFRRAYITSSWTAVESSTTSVSLVNLCIEYYYTNMLETIANTVWDANRSLQMSAAAVRSRQLMWDRLRWLRFVAPGYDKTVVGVEADKIGHELEGDGACFWLENDAGVAFKAYATNSGAGAWGGYYREIDCVYGETDDPTTSVGQEVGGAEWAWEYRNLGSISTQRLAALRNYDAAVDWYVGWDKRAQVGTGKVFEYDGKNHFWSYQMRYIIGSEVGDYAFNVLCHTNFLAQFSVDNSRFWYDVDHATKRVATQTKVAGYDATNYVITLEGDLEDIAEDGGFSTSWSESGTPPDSGISYTYAGNLKLVPSWRFVVRECYAVMKLDGEGGFEYVEE